VPPSGTIPAEAIVRRALRTARRPDRRRTPRQAATSPAGCSPTPTGSCCARHPARCCW
jgi:hypothetical protein